MLFSQGSLQSLKRHVDILPLLRSIQAALFFYIGFSENAGILDGK